MLRKVALVVVAVALVIGGGAAIAQAASRPQVRIIDFRSGPAKHGVDISRPAMVKKLKGTSPAFKQYVATRVRSMINHHACSASVHTITVDKYATNGYALGAVGDCGGYVAIWGVRDGAWRELIGTQDVFRCGQLHRNHVPVGLLDDGKCYIPGHAHLVKYAG